MSELNIANEIQLTHWLNHFESQLEQAATVANAASFNQYAGVSGTPYPGGGLGSLGDLFANPAYPRLLDSWLPQVTTPLLQRRLFLLSRLFVEAAVSQDPAIVRLRNQLNSQLLHFRPLLGSQAIRRSDVSEILRTNPDRTFRQRAFEQVLTPLARQLAPQVQSLMVLRNTAACKVGFTNFATLQLSLNELEPGQLWQIFDELEDFTAPIYARLLAKASARAGIRQPQIWDLSWLAEQEPGFPPALFPGSGILAQVQNFLSDLGLPPSELPIQVVSRDVPFGGLCYTVRIPDDIRLLVNPKAGYPSFRTILHEFGHAVHAAFNQQQFYSLKYEPGVFNEGMAETLAYFSHDSAWLQQQTGLTEAAFKGYQQAGLLRRLLRLRTLMAQARFEIEAYQNPTQDLELRYAQLESHYLQVPLNSTPRWAASSFPITHPVYRQNYVLAEMIAAQTHATLQARFGEFGAATATTRQQVWDWLDTHYFAPGAAQPWPAKMVGATGQGLNLEPLFSHFNAALS